MGCVISYEKIFNKEDIEVIKVDNNYALRNVKNHKFIWPFTNCSIMIDEINGIITSLALDKDKMPTLSAFDIIKNEVLFENLLLEVDYSRKESFTNCLLKNVTNNSYVTWNKYQYSKERNIDLYTYQDVIKIYEDFDNTMYQVKKNNLYGMYIFNDKINNNLIIEPTYLEISSTYSKDFYMPSGISIFKDEQGYFYRYNKEIVHNKNIEEPVYFDSIVRDNLNFYTNMYGTKNNEKYIFHSRDFLHFDLLFSIKCDEIYCAYEADLDELCLYYIYKLNGRYGLIKSDGLNSKILIDSDAYKNEAAFNYDNLDEFEIEAIKNYFALTTNENKETKYLRLLK